MLLATQTSGDFEVCVAKTNICVASNTMFRRSKSPEVCVANTNVQEVEMPLTFVLLAKCWGRSKSSGDLTCPN